MEGQSLGVELNGHGFFVEGGKEKDMMVVNLIEEWPFIELNEKKDSCSWLQKFEIMAIAVVVFVYNFVNYSLGPYSLLLW